MQEGRILTRDWDLYDTRHLVLRHPSMSVQTLESGYWRAYERFYRLGNIRRSALSKDTSLATLRHLAYTRAWKKIDPLWNVVIRLRKIHRAIPLLETLLQGDAQSTLQDWDARTMASSLKGGRNPC